MGVSLKNAFLRFSQQYKLFQHNQNVLIALSGGMDSMVMLNLLLEWERHFGLNLAAVHINHQLRGKESDRDQESAQKYCQQKNIPIYIEKIDVRKFAKENGYSLEEAGHIRREQIYEQYLEEKNFDLVATAHNLNDQAETIIMHILEGTGLDGLAGIHLQRNGIVRPLLFAERREIERYARQKNLAFREDRSNKDLRFKRNKIRHRLLPFLEQEFSLNKLDNFFKMGLILQDWLNHLEILVEAFTKTTHVDEKKERVTCKVEEYLTLFSGIQIKALENILLQLTGSEMKLDFNTFHGFKSWLEADKEGTKFQLHPEVLVSCKGEFLVFRQISNLPSKIKLEIPTENVYNLSDAGIQLILKEVEPNQVEYNEDHSIEFVDREKIEFPLMLRNWKNGDKFQPLGSSHRRLVSDFLTDLKIEFPRKKNIFVLEQRGEIIAIPGYRISEKFKLTPKTKRVLKIELHNN